MIASSKSIDTCTTEDARVPVGALSVQCLEGSVLGGSVEVLDAPVSNARLFVWALEHAGSLLACGGSDVRRIDICLLFVVNRFT